MILSFQKFINFLKDNEGIFSVDETEKLHSILFQSTLDVILDTSFLSNEMGISDLRALNILQILVNNELIELSPVICAECGYEKVEVTNTKCENCGASINLKSAYYSRITGLLSETEKQKSREQHIRTEQADSIASAWEKDKYITYILFDLSQSEKIQSQDDMIYKETLDKIRDIIFKYALEKINGTYLLLGEIGDCFKIAFSNIADIFIFIDTFAKKHQEVILKKDFPTQRSEGFFYPCMNAVANCIELPKQGNHNISPKEIIFTTLSGSTDFNSSSLTSLFRLSGGIKLKYEKAYEGDNYLCLWLFEDLYKKLDSCKNAPTVLFEAGKHKDLLIEKKAIAFRFPKGIRETVFDPSCIIETNTLEKNTFN